MLQGEGLVLDEGYGRREMCILVPTATLEEIGAAAENHGREYDLRAAVDPESLKRRRHRPRLQAQPTVVYKTNS